MSEFIIDDWKLKARTVVKLYRKNTNTLVSSRIAALYYRPTVLILSITKVFG